ncbi:uncharacterized protein LOC132743210 isoform X2 [Ruditapes philippinarum]|uniref:uncharacterized protein LOC132743210 isoform X2 n=1 Tax=Ruditapes philippinarum TaxID=129788 RepID=UPI00295ACED7|nr:uncharacterized protein LOC132743210 isoform X2 [Ruditapes philippinarum]
MYTKQGDSTKKGEENVEDFLKNLFNEVLVEERWASEISDLKSAMKEIMERFVIEAFETTDEDENESLKKQLKPVGSMEDGTSICKPDEFDFIFEIPYTGYESKPSANLDTVTFPVNHSPRLVVKPGDMRFRRLFRDGAEVKSTNFLQHFGMKFKKAVVALSEAEPVRRCGYSLQMRDPSCPGCYSGFQGPAFHLHNHLAWISPSGEEHFVSIDLVPAVVMQDEELCKQAPKFDDNDTDAREHGTRSKYYLIPIKSRSIVMSLRVFIDGESEKRKDFATSNFAISFVEYENDIMKQWKRETSLYHSWYICYTLLKCFGTINHSCTGHVNIEESGNASIQAITPFSHPEHNETLSSYAWKLLIFEQAKISNGERLSLYTCFDSIISMLHPRNLSSISEVRINSFWCQEVMETVYLRQKNSDQSTDLVVKMAELNSLIQDIQDDERYNYDFYKNKLFKIFTKLEEALSEHVP